MWLMKRIDYIERQLIALSIMILCAIIIAIKSIFVPLRTWYNVWYAYVYIEGINHCVYDCTIEEYVNGEVIIYHDNGKLVANVNDIRMYGEYYYK